MIDATSTAPARFREHLRGKRALLVAIALLCVSGLWLLPWFLTDFHAAFFNLPGLEARYVQAIPPFRWAHALTGIELMPQLWLWPLAMAIVVFVLLLVLEWVIWKLGIDPADDAWTSLLWSLGSWRGWLAWMVGVVALSLLAAGIASLFDDAVAGVVGATALMAAVTLSLPFFAYNADSAALACPPPLWKPRWPGWFPVLAGIIVLVVLIGIALVGDFLDDGVFKGMQLGLELATWPLLALLIGGLAALWLDRGRSFRKQGWDKVRPWPRLRRIMLQDVRLYMVLGLAIGGPVLAAAVMNIFFVPDAASYLEGRGKDLPFVWDMLARAGRAARDYQHALVLLEWFPAVALARLLVQMGVVGLQPASTPPTHPDFGPASTAPPTA